jgi:phospholipase/carboxylesterase
MTWQNAWRWLVLGVVAWSAASAAQEPAETAPARVSAPVSAPETPPPLPDAPPDASGWGVAAGLRYLEIVRGGADPKAKLPLLLVIHGLGDKPNLGWVHTIDVDEKVKARMILPQAPTPRGTGFSWFDYRAANLDQVALANNMAAIEARVAQMIEVLLKQRPTRGRRVFVTGFSQGGMLSYALAVKHPQLIEFAMPISGMLPAPLWPDHPRGQAWAPRTHALHGTSDTVVRMAIDAQLVEHLKSLGYAAELVPYQGVGHAVTPEMSAEAKRTLSAVLAPAAHKRRASAAAQVPR